MIGLQFDRRHDVVSAPRTIFVQFIVFIIALLLIANMPARAAASSTIPSSASVSLDIQPGIVDVEVQANSTNNRFNITNVGGTVNSTVITYQPSHGTVVISGTTLIYTPTPGYGGPDSFGYFIFLANGAAMVGGVNLFVVPNSMEILTRSLSAGAVGIDYYQTIVAAGAMVPIVSKSHRAVYPPVSIWLTTDRCRVYRTRQAWLSLP
ncbi:hypothetical protein GR212_35770 [Rhizobium lusitanum]|uniref:Uncharacterized protein n=1 Tax=Rhizobium lusitanum TaxID=293958 RepID=A0A6L9UGY8_9HYPH|nr:Ig-like domain-containing protein [Rhizobium lusitanum]NEI74894.1 hypothetical protein [Rhizobium lusitanum]